MKKLILFLALLPLLIAAQCNPTPQPPPAPVIDGGPVPVVVDASPAPAPTADAAPAPLSDAAKACANLGVLKCAEAMPGCEAALQHVVATEHTSINLSCLIKATSKSAVHECGKLVTCP